MALGTTVRETNIDCNQGAFAFYGLRELAPSADIDYESGTGNETFAYDMLTHGPVAGFGFRF